MLARIWLVLVAPALIVTALIARCFRVALPGGLAVLHLRRPAIHVLKTLVHLGLSAARMMLRSAMVDLGTLPFKHAGRGAFSDGMRIAMRNLRPRALRAMIELRR